MSSADTERFSTAEGISPWYLKRWVLALWGLAVVILIATIIYGLAILAKGGGGGTPATTPTRPSTSALSRTSSPSLTPSSTLPTTTAPSPSTETTDPDVPTTAPWTQQHPHRHWWRSNLPPIPAIPHF